MNGGDARATAYTFSATIKISAKTLEAMLWWFQICKVDGWSREDQDGDAVGEHRRTCVASVLDWLVLDFPGKVQASTHECDDGGNNMA